MQKKYDYKERLPFRKETRISWGASGAAILQKVAICDHTVVFGLFNSLLILSLYLYKKLSLNVCIKLQSVGFWRLCLYFFSPDNLHFEMFKRNKYPLYFQNYNCRCFRWPNDLISTLGKAETGSVSLQDLLIPSIA